MKQIINSPASLGQAIRRVRKRKKLSQTQAGEPFNVTQCNVSRVEQGKNGIQIDTLFRLLAALDLELVIREKDPDNFRKEDW